MNNKGQSLILFVMLMPLLLLILFMVYEIGEMTLLKQELDNINKIALNYGIDKLNDDNIVDSVKNIIVKNKNDIDDISVVVENNTMHIVLEDKLNMKMSLFKNIIKVRSSFMGYIDNDKKIIKRDK